VVFSAAAMLAACGSLSPQTNSYRGSEQPANSQTTGAPVEGRALAAETPASAASPPDPSKPTADALNLRLLEKVSPTVGDGDLPVGPGDLIEISVFEVEELSKLRLRIPERGIISVPLIGHIQAAGRTATELEDEIRTRLEQKYMHNPQVAVFVHEHNSQRVTVMGAVRHGGVITLNRQVRLADALANAEGLADDADPVVYVIRRVPAGTVKHLEATAAAANGAAAVSAPATPPAAAAPSPGDVNAKDASAKGKEEVMIPIDLSELAKGRDELNIQLRPGDVVHVPRAGSFYVGGFVERPGSFLLKGKTTLQQAVLAAGGVKNTADWSDVRLYRRAPSGEVDVKTVDLNEIEKGQPSPEIQRNDVVIVGVHAGKAFAFGFLDFFKGALGMAKGF
jgi:polysaccharide export outer membrane protein